MAVAVDTVTWDLEPLVGGKGPAGVDELLDEAEAIATQLSEQRGKVASFGPAELESFMRALERLADLTGRAGSYAALWFSTDTTDPERGALLQRVQERSTAISTKLVFFELEWATLEDDRAEELLAHEGLAFCRHHLRMQRRYRDFLLSEPEEKILKEKAVTGSAAWSRLFEEHTSTIQAELDGERVPLMEALSRLQDPDRAVRRRAAEAVTAALAPGLRMRAFIYNTLVYDKAVDDRLRGYPHWLAARNLANEVSDGSVRSLIEAVTARYDIPQRWYALKAKLLGLDRLADYDRMAPLVADDVTMAWDEAVELVLDSYRSFSDELGAAAARFVNEPWIDAPVRPGKRPGAFCSYTVPSVHPYILLNWTNRRRDALTLAHELGHGVHALLASVQGIFHQSTPLTLAETASVFGETIVFGRLLDQIDDPRQRLGLLAENLEGAIATVFRQIAMNRFEDAVHEARRAQGELSVDTLCSLWRQTQEAMLGDSVELTKGYDTWWSYVPHFIGAPGYVYAYAYGQLLALSVYRRYEELGDAFVDDYLTMLRSGGSMSPEELGALVGIDLTDPGFWDKGLSLVEERLRQAEALAASL
jgi:oligoendopeptidase F